MLLAVPGSAQAHSSSCVRPGPHSHCVWSRVVVGGWCSFRCSVFASCWRVLRCLFRELAWSARSRGSFSAFSLARRQSLLDVDTRSAGCDRADDDDYDSQPQAQAATPSRRSRDHGRRRSSSRIGIGCRRHIDGRRVVHRCNRCRFQLQAAGVWRRLSAD